MKKITILLIMTALALSASACKLQKTESINDANVHTEEAQTIADNSDGAEMVSIDRDYYTFEVPADFSEADDVADGVEMWLAPDYGTGKKLEVQTSTTPGQIIYKTHEEAVETQGYQGSEYEKILFEYKDSEDTEEFIWITKVTSTMGDGSPYVYYFGCRVISDKNDESKIVGMGSSTGDENDLELMEKSLRSLRLK